MVRLDAKLVRMPEQRIVAQISVSREQRAAADASDEIADEQDAQLTGLRRACIGGGVGHRSLRGRRLVLSHTLPMDPGK